MKRSRMVGVAMALAGAVLTSSPATARQTNIDAGGTRILSGYCDFNGDDCTPQQLGFSVDFGSGPTSSFIIYGNGLISFGSTPVDYAKSATFSTFNGDTLAAFGGTVISPGLFNTITTDFNGTGDQVFATNAVLRFNDSTGFGVTYQYCSGTSTCNTQAEVDVTKTASGLHVHFFNYSDFFDADSPGTEQTEGYSINGVAKMTGLAEFVDIPARIGDPVSPTTGAVPEPTTWAMMLVGFGAVGAALRRRRGKAEAPALAS